MIDVDTARIMETFVGIACVHLVLTVRVLAMEALLRRTIATSPRSWPPTARRPWPAP